MNLCIKEVLKKKGITMIELASRLGVSRQTVHYYIEQGDKNPIAQLEKIANAVGCNVWDFFETDIHEETPGVRCPKCGTLLRVQLAPIEDEAAHDQPEDVSEN